MSVALNKETLLGIAAVVAFACCSELAVAQDRSVLAGLEELQLIVEDPTEAGRACGLNAATIQSSFATLVKSTKLKIVDAASTAFIIATTTARSKAGTCASAGILRLASIQNVTLRFSGKDAAPALLLWDDWWVDLSTEPSGHPRQVQQSIENSIRSFLKDWTAANKQ